MTEFKQLSDSILQPRQQELEGIATGLVVTMFTLQGGEKAFLSILGYVFSNLTDSEKIYLLYQFVLHCLFYNAGRRKTTK